MKQEFPSEENIISKFTQNEKLSEYESLINKLKEIKDKVIKLEDFLPK